jgi:hypothetical protein
MTSLHQKDIDKIREKNEDINILLPSVKPCIVNTPLVVSVNKAKQVNMGQGEGDTR